MTAPSLDPLVSHLPPAAVERMVDWASTGRAQIRLVWQSCGCRRVDVNIAGRGLALHERAEMVASLRQWGFSRADDGIPSLNFIHMAKALACAD